MWGLGHSAVVQARVTAGSQRAGLQRPRDPQRSGRKYDKSVTHQPTLGFEVVLTGLAL